MTEQTCGDTEYFDGPRTLRDPGERERRRAMLILPHMAPLVEYAAELRKRNGVEAPEFDPLDGGVDAQILFLFEKPGPMTARAGRRIGSGFISRNNDDRTAEATYKFMCQAGIPRHRPSRKRPPPCQQSAFGQRAGAVRNGDLLIAVHAYVYSESARVFDVILLAK
jgi:hypothetical protein